LMSFFFQAEDGIRDLIVTGVQTCALPISEQLQRRRSRHGGPEAWIYGAAAVLHPRGDGAVAAHAAPKEDETQLFAGDHLRQLVEIGRASCRERVEISVCAVAW